jgi:hypothetical protein
LHSAGVANSVQTEVNQATSEAFTDVRDRLQEQDACIATILQTVKASANALDDNATAFSALTAQTAMQDQKRRIEDLEARLRAVGSTVTTEGSTRGGGSTYTPRSGGTTTPRTDTSRGGGVGRGGTRGGRSSGRGGGGRRRSDGPACCTKNSKFFSSSDTYCWSCGYDCGTNHDSMSCKFKAQGHQDTATGANPLGGAIKDKEFSKWK